VVVDAALMTLRIKMHPLTVKASLAVVIRETIQMLMNLISNFENSNLLNEGE